MYYCVLHVNKILVHTHIIVSLLFSKHCVAMFQKYIHINNGRSMVYQKSILKTVYE